ncbi:MAG: polysaccharide deacetylase family protein [Burkholderiales bacterium]
MRRLLATALWPYATIAGALRPGLRILMYHRVASLPAYDQLTVSPARFERQMRQLSARHRVVSLADGLQALGAGLLYSPLVAVTFDDGYLDNLTAAAPILARYGIPATIFVTTRFCDQAASHPRYGQPAQRLHLNWDEVAALAAAPGITIGSHTLSHPYLPTLGDAQAQREIEDSRREIEARIGQPVDYFCYPSGDLSPRELQLVRQAGYAAAVSVAPGVNQADADRFQLRRTEVTDRDDDFDFALKLAGAFDPLHRLLHARRTQHFVQSHVKPNAPVRTEP